MNLENQEQSGITPMNELEYAQEGLEDGDWGEVENCLTELAKKIDDSSPSSDEKTELRDALEGLKFNIDATGVPEEYKDRIARAIESAEKYL